MAWRVFAPHRPEPEREYRFMEDRRFRFDFAFPKARVAVEIEGGIWLAKGRHVSGVGYGKDVEKYNCAVLSGWRVLRFTGDMLREDPRGCVETVLRLLDGEPCGF